MNHFSKVLNFYKQGKIFVFSIENNFEQTRGEMCHHVVVDRQCLCSEDNDFLIGFSYLILSSSSVIGFPAEILMSFCSTFVLRSGTLSKKRNFFIHTFAADDRTGRWIDASSGSL